VKCLSKDKLKSCDLLWNVLTKINQEMNVSTRYGRIAYPKSVSRKIQLCSSNRRANLGGLANSWTRTAL